jgi:hypothetical protein
MNCCKKNENQNDIVNTNQEHIQTDNQKHSCHKSHLKMMALCCGIPILLILLLPLLGYKGFLLGIIPFICPIMMVLMVPMMMLMGKKENSSKGMNHNNKE